MHRRYTASTMVVAAAGGLDFDRLCDIVEKELGGIEPCGRDVELYQDFEPRKGDLVMQEKPIEQAHICLAMPGFALGDDRIYPLSVLNNVFGGSMSSRLFQTIREQRGLAYDIYSHRLLTEAVERFRSMRALTRNMPRNHCR
jgi:predicted Zn-dependent peptidase